ncbi:ACR3 family arsenite efflux transporter [Actinomadura atramentaria]|uniref:ACR3 family arsenite efflux transporter n=1 Tax=Actinomadura atramentaria TaxID=1990 RepID=UPI00037B3883|nr:ACR3 family arsenite efflux transporter [Actinomadura atramentaria]
MTSPGQANGPGSDSATDPGAGAVTGTGSRADSATGSDARAVTGTDAATATGVGPTTGRAVGDRAPRRLSRVDRLLPLWIGAAMAAGLAAGRAVPGLDRALDAVRVGGISLPIAVGLLVMMYPVLAKVRYDRVGAVARDRRLLVPSLLLNWVVGPAVMFALAWLLLPDLPEYRTGLIIVGLARCIAMVVIWNDLACGDREAAAVLVAVNSVFQVVAFGLLGWFYLTALPGMLGLEQVRLDASAWDIARSVLVFLGVPLAAGYATRRAAERARGRDWYERRFLPRVGPAALYGLLFTIVVLFALQGDAVTSHPGDVARIALPLLLYFALMWAGSFALGRAVGLPYDRTATLAFTAAGNNFELAIAVAVATFGVTSGQALAGVVGPLIEVPVLVGLVHVSLALRRREGST